MIARDKIRDVRQLAPVLARFREERRRIVFTNGCFDLLHVGHLRYLESARALGDVLIVGLNTDGSVRRIKGNERPIVPEMERAELLCGLYCVDHVVLFDSPDPLPLIEMIRPDVLVKGADWAVEDIVGADYVESLGGKVLRIPLVPHASTSSIIERILHRYEGVRRPAEGCAVSTGTSKGGIQLGS